MMRSLLALAIVLSLGACDRKPRDCVDPNTYENRCIEAELNRQNEQPSPTVVQDNHYVPYNNHTVVEQRTVVVKEQPKTPSVDLGTIMKGAGAVIGAYAGKKAAEKAQQNVQEAPRAPVRTIPIVPQGQPYNPPPRPSYTPPKPTYVQPKPAYSAPPTVTVRPNVPSRPFVPSSPARPSVTVRGR